jgi:DNA polymerase
LLATKAPITRVRGQFYEFPPQVLARTGLPAAKLMPTYHPAYLLRNPAAKSEAWQDLQQVMKVLGLKVGRHREV